VPHAQAALLGNTGAHSAIEMALLDLLGRSSGLPAVDLIGGAVRPAVAPMWLLGNATPSKISPRRARRAQGFDFFKLKIGTKPVDTEIASTLALRRAWAPTPLAPTPIAD
jgi:muconate cycloisomerase